MDIILSLCGILVILPFFPLIAILIKLDSRGPIFYLAKRVGKDMKMFNMYKLRTMIETDVKVGESVSPQHDPRVTSFGRFLRRTKLNELPQLINILKGEMTFVGPRPESPDLAEMYPEEARKIFTVKPGLVGPNQIIGRNEEEMYPAGVDVKRFYIEEILPEKLVRDIEYIKKPDFFTDMKYIYLGVRETMLGALNKSHIRNNRAQIYLLLADLFFTIASFFIAFSYEVGKIPAGSQLFVFFKYLSVIILFRTACFFHFGLYSTLIKYISYHDVLNVFKSVTAGSLLMIIFDYLIGLQQYTKMIFVIDWLILLNSLALFRMGLRVFWDRQNRMKVVENKHRILIVGAGDAGSLAYQTLTAERNSPFEIIGFIDDAPEKYRRKLHNLIILGNRHNIKELAVLYKIDEVLIAMPSAPPESINRIIEICQRTGVKYRVFSSTYDPNTLRLRNAPIRSLELVDIVHLKKIKMNYKEVNEAVKDKTILITGSGGTLGLELCRQLLQAGCRKIIIMERYESYLAELASSLFNLFPKEYVIPVLVASDRIEQLKKVFEKHHPQIVLHTSMRKYVPFFDVNEDEVASINYMRTFNLVNLVSKYNCELFVMVSSIVAAKCDSYISVSLRLAEIALIEFFKDLQTKLVITRLCDILESRGNIVQIIENQIHKKETVTLPSPDATINLISKYSASEFLLQSIADAAKIQNGEELFVCEPGAPVPLLEITSKIATLHNLTLGVDFAVKYVEELLDTISSEQEEFLMKSCYYEDIKIIKETSRLSSQQFRDAIKKFVLNSDNNVSYQDWEKQTQEFLKKIVEARMVETVV